MPLQPAEADELQYPNTPKLTSSTVASGIALIIGVDKVLKSNSTKAAKKRIDNGVAGRNIVGSNCLW